MEGLARGVPGGTHPRPCCIRGNASREALPLADGTVKVWDLRVRRMRANARGPQQLGQVRGL